MTVVLLTVDCLRRSHLGCYGYDRPTTPNIDQLADSDTVALFKQSYANCPGTQWAFQAIHLGATTARIDGSGIPEQVEPLATKFQRADYATGGFAVNGFLSRDWGYDTGFKKYYSVGDKKTSDSWIRNIGSKIQNIADSKLLDEYIFRPARFWLIRQAAADSDESDDNKEGPGVPHTDADTVDAAINWLQSLHTDQPYLLWVHFMDAHTPYGYWPDHLQAIRGDTDVNYSPRPDEEDLLKTNMAPPQDVIDIYDSGIREVDRQIGRLLTHIKDDATIILTGDHGEEFGTYREFHTRSFYPTMTDVPLIIQSTQIPGGSHDVPVQHLDIAPTLHDELDIPDEDYHEGTSITELSKNDEFTKDRQIFFSLKSNEFAVHKEDKVIEDLAGERAAWRFEDIKSREPISLDSVPKINATLDDYIEFVRDTRIGETNLAGAEDEGLSEDTKANLEQLGYLDDSASHVYE